MFFRKKLWTPVMLEIQIGQEMAVMKILCIKCLKLILKSKMYELECSQYYRYDLDFISNSYPDKKALAIRTQKLEYHAILLQGNPSKHLWIFRMILALKGMIINSVRIMTVIHYIFMTLSRTMYTQVLDNTVKKKKVFILHQGIEYCSASCLRKNNSHVSSTSSNYSNLAFDENA